MAGRRMFARTVVTTGRFARLSAQEQALYYALGMEADDDGFAEGAMVLRMFGREEADLRALEQAGYVKVYGEDLITYILDWDTNNQIRKDRYRESQYAWLLNEEPQKEETPPKAVSSKEAASGQEEPPETAEEPAPEETGEPVPGDGKPEREKKAPQKAISPKEEAELVRRAEQRVTELREKRRREKEALREARLREGAYYIDVDKLMDGA